MRKKPEVTLTTYAKGYWPDIQEILMVDKPVAVDVHLKPANLVSGSVVNEVGAPLSDAYVFFKVWHGDWIYLHQANTNKNGEFTWADVPAERLTVATRADGYRDKGEVIMTAGTPARIVMESLMNVSGTVVDAETGMPIPSFTVIHGEDNKNGEPIEWMPWPQVGMIKGTNGKFSYTGEIHEPEHALRVEADGYIPGESRRYTENEKHVQLEFKLTRGPDLVNKVFAADNKPAVGAEAVLVENGNWLEIAEVGRMVEDPCQHVKVAADGTVRFKPAAKDFKVVAFDENGMAQATAEQCAPARRLSCNHGLGSREHVASAMCRRPSKTSSFIRVPPSELPPRPRSDLRNLREPIQRAILFSITLLRAKCRLVRSSMRKYLADIYGLESGINGFP